MLSKHQVRSEMPSTWYMLRLSKETEKKKKIAILSNSLKNQSCIFTRVDHQESS